MQGLTWAIASSGSVGSTQVYKLLKYAHQLESASPLQDRQLIEFALSLQPSLQNDPVHEKVFLRQANLESLPTDVLWRPKENYFDPLKYAGIAKGHQAVKLLEQVKTCACLHEIVDAGQLEFSLNSYRQEYSDSYCAGLPFHNTIASQIYILLVFSGWNCRVNKLLEK
jgi:asparagine synthase (glutamine-hydrolysing)